MYKASLIYVILLYFLSTSNVLSFINEISNNNIPIWINPCGYDSIKNEVYNSNKSIINRIITLANLSNYNINLFKYNYIKYTFKLDYYTHYKRWVYENNSWMIPRLLNYAEDDVSKERLVSCSFPSELIFTYDILQRVAVGFELLLEDAKVNYTTEHYFLNKFSSFQNNLKQLLCEVSDSIDITFQDIPKYISRNVIPDEVKKEKNTAKRNLTNSIIFRDYMIAIKYIISTYNYLKIKN